MGLEPLKSVYKNLKMRIENFMNLFGPKFPSNMNLIYYDKF